MSIDPLSEERWREYEAAIDELREKCRVKRDELRRKLKQKIWNIPSEWNRKFDVGMEEEDRKYAAEIKKLEKKREAERYPFQVNQISVSSIPSAPVQKVIPLQVDIGSLTV